MGHLFRGLVLAAALERRGAAVRFLVNDFAQAAAILRERGRPFETVPLHDLDSGWETALVERRGIRVWINDRLRTDAGHAKRVADAGARLATFDDYGTGAPLADLHVAALPFDASGPPAGKRVLAGLRYLVLDPEIRRYRRLRKERRSLVVTLGGSDTYGLTVEVVRALRELGMQASIILGPGFGHERELEPLLDARFAVKRDVRMLAAELAAHDLAVTAGGITLFEACAVGLPCIAIAAEPWEQRSIETLAKLGVCTYAGYRSGFERSVLGHPLPLEAMSRAGMEAVHLEGVERVAEALLEL
jgi:spore coat polysaccharide biosynthesis predicted glycosyltransferase SpsG